MIKGTLLPAIPAFALLMAGLLFAYQSSTSDLPPGVASADWTPITSNLGVQLIRDRKWIGPPGDLHCTLYLKEKNAWHKLYFTPAPASLVPTR